jgi:hypothetical protein
MAPMFERYTDRARRVIVLADSEARGLGHDTVDTGHLLLGLLGEGEAVAFRALDALGVTLDAARDAVLKRRPAGGAHPGGHRAFTPPLKRALELGLREAILLNCPYVGTEHLLLGLIREGGDGGALALADCGGSDPGFLGGVRAKVLELLHGYAKAEEARNVVPRVYSAPMIQDEGEDVPSLLPDLPEPPSWYELVVTVPGEDDDRSLPLAPNGGAVSSETVLTMQLRAKTLSEAMILAAALGAWTKAPGARAEVRPA